ncbi:MAG: sulfotransferase domain-containing protein, partial [Promethearchaeota archaeon]
LLNIHYWIYHYKKTINKCDLVLNYEKLKENPYYYFSKVIKLIGVELNENALSKGIEISSFKNIKKMSVETDQLYGIHNPKTFRGVFMRSGKSNQYQHELKPKTINLVKSILKKNDLEFIL